MEIGDQEYPATMDPIFDAVYFADHLADLRACRRVFLDRPGVCACVRPAG